MRLVIVVWLISATLLGFASSTRADIITHSVTSGLNLLSLDYTVIAGSTSNSVYIQNNFGDDKPLFAFTPVDPRRFSIRTASFELNGEFGSAIWESSTPPSLTGAISHRLFLQNLFTQVIDVNETRAISAGTSNSLAMLVEYEAYSIRATELELLYDGSFATTDGFVGIDGGLLISASGSAAPVNSAAVALRDLSLTFNLELEVLDATYLQSDLPQAVFRIEDAIHWNSFVGSGSPPAGFEFAAVPEPGSAVIAVLLIGACVRRGNRHVRF